MELKPLNKSLTYTLASLIFLIAIIYSFYLGSEYTKFHFVNDTNDTIEYKYVQVQNQTIPDETANMPSNNDSTISYVQINNVIYNKTYTSPADYLMLRDTYNQMHVLANEFKVLKSGYTAYGIDTRRNLAFINDMLIEGADGATFEVSKNQPFYNRWSQDKKLVYFNGKKVDILDPKTFVIIDEGNEKDCGYGPYIRDKNGVYYLSDLMNKIVDADPDTFEVLFQGYSRDKNHVYRYGKIRTDLDPKSDPQSYTPQCDIG